ncbi:MAG: DUF2802 domain-containing protein [Steroidobacteraceae bacterium]|jgi:hypothetical protein|nr:DUF2802 domain-containing protein [Steroidobacteraceae bacterium]
MFEILPTPSLETLLIVLRGAMLIGAFWVFALAFIRWRRADERESERLRAQLDKTFSELRSLHETIAVMSARLDALGERAETEARVAPATTPAARGYDLAARLARNGADAEQLVSACGLTRHEAELLTRLHGRQAPQTPSAAPAGRKRGSLLSVVG